MKDTQVLQSSGNAMTSKLKNPKILVKNLFKKLNKQNYYTDCYHYSINYMQVPIYLQGIAYQLKNILCIST